MTTKKKNKKLRVLHGKANHAIDEPCKFCDNVKKEYEADMTTKDVISLSKYCVNCYPKIERAFYTYKGNSLCHKCFKNPMTTKTKVNENAMRLKSSHLQKQMKMKDKWEEEFDNKWDTESKDGGFYRDTSDAQTRINIKSFICCLLSQQKQQIRKMIEGERIRIINELKKVECNFCGNKQPTYGCACGGYMKALSDILEEIKSLWQQKRKIYN